jgi:hypothetical protein
MCDQFVSVEVCKHSHAARNHDPPTGTGLAQCIIETGNPLGASDALAENTAHSLASQQGVHAPLENAHCDGIFHSRVGDHVNRRSGECVRVLWRG